MSELNLDDWSLPNELVAQIEGVIAERDALKAALQEIADTTTSQPAALNMPEEDWYRRIAWNCIGTAARAIPENTNE